MSLGGFAAHVAIIRGFVRATVRALRESGDPHERQFRHLCLNANLNRGAEPELRRDDREETGRRRAGRMT
jgi:hypothetical protein